MIFDQFNVARLRRRAAAERHYHGDTARNHPHARLDRFTLHPPEYLLTERVEDLGDGTLLARLDILVDVGKAPSQPFGQQLSDRGLARAHESDEVQTGCLSQFQNHFA